jgi:hypothetical protein
MTWTLSENQAVFKDNTLSASLDVQMPRSGIQNIAFGTQTLPGLKPLQVTVNPPVNQETIIEAYVRGDDLVATYAQLPERTVRPQLYLRHLDADSLAGQGQRAGLELMVAVQTCLLDSDPTLSAFTEASAAEVLALGADQRDWESVDLTSASESACQLSAEKFAGVFVFRLSDCDLSYAELVYPSDFQGAELHVQDHSVALSYHLFPEFLEKGVIRKGRIRALVMERSGDLTCAQRCFEQWAAAPPPLTV